MLPVSACPFTASACLAADQRRSDKPIHCGATRGRAACYCILETRICVILIRCDESERRGDLIPLAPGRRLDGTGQTVWEGCAALTVLRRVGRVEGGESIERRCFFAFACGARAALEQSKHGRLQRASALLSARTDVGAGCKYDVTTLAFGTFGVLGRGWSSLARFLMPRSSRILRFRSIFSRRSFSNSESPPTGILR